MKNVIKGNVNEIQGIKVSTDDTEMTNELISGRSVYHWEYGVSLFPLIRSGEYCKISPIKDVNDIRTGDVVYCFIRSREGIKIPMVHMVTKISDASYSKEKWFEIGDTRGFVFGWSNEILGKAVGTNIFHEE